MSSPNVSPSISLPGSTRAVSRHTWNSAPSTTSRLAALRALGESKGYELVYTDVYAPNAFFVRREELPEPWPVISSERAARGGDVGEPPDPKRRPWVRV